MAGTSKSLHKYFRNVDDANAALAERWRAITNHLRLGLGTPIPTSALLLRTYEPPRDYAGEDGKKHRKPMRALYGFGEAARERFESDAAQYERFCTQLRAEIDTANASVYHWLGRAQAGDATAIRWYCQTMLPSIYPLPPAGVAYLASGYSTEERHLVVERFVPGIGVLPTVDHYEISRRLEFHRVDMPERDRTAWYAEFLSQIALLSADRTYRSEIGHALEKVTVNCLAVLRNPATGHFDVVCVLSVGIPRRQFASINLLGVDPATCVRSFDGRLTAQPGEYSPVLPWVTAEATGDLRVDVRGAPLLEMNPSTFEQLVAELMRRMGLRTEHTGMSGDGGVDCVAYDDRPVFGGKVIVQVKRYSSTVNPSVVRDLFGTVHASGASKGVLVTTSGFGPESREFAQGKPLELIDGAQLDALLRQYGLAGSMSQQLDTGIPELAQELPPVSPDGRYYWDGRVWQPIDSQ
jgi:restriction system protein